MPAGEVWVHCAGGYRASVAASLLDAAGRRPVAIDDSFDNATAAGLPLGRPPAGRYRVTLVLVAAVAGTLIGLSLGALGGGGSILAVPVLVYGLGQSPAQATTGSLVVVGVSSLVGALAAHRAGNVLLGRGVAFGAVALGGAVAGARAAGHVPEPVLLAAFALLMLLVGGLMALRQWRSHRRRGTTDGAGRPRRSTTRSSPSARPSPASARVRSRCSSPPPSWACSPGSSGWVAASWWSPRWCWASPCR